MMIFLKYIFEKNKSYVFDDRKHHFSQFTTKCCSIAHFTCGVLSQGQASSEGHGSGVRYELTTLSSFYDTRELDLNFLFSSLTHWVMHICVIGRTNIGSDNGLSPGWRQAIIWTNVEILFSRPLGTNLNEILIEIHTFSFQQMCLKMSSG